MKSRAVLILSSLLALVVISSAALGYLLWHNYQVALDENAQLKSDLISAKGTGEGTTLGVSDSTSDVSPGGAQTSGMRTMTVKDFGIQLQVAATLTDLTYAENPPASGFLQLTTLSLQKGYPCAAAGILGAMFRYPKGTPLPATAAAGSSQKVATAGSYDYYYLPLEKNPCTDRSALTAIQKATADVTTALKTITETP